MHSCLQKMVCVGIVLAGASLHADYIRKNHHLFINESDMPIKAKVVYVGQTALTCRPSESIVYNKGAVDKKGKAQSNQWTAHGYLCCVKRIEIYDGADNILLQSIAIDNIDHGKLHTAGQVIALAGTAAAAYQGDTTGALMGNYSVQRMAQEHPYNTNPVIECGDNSRWVYSGSSGIYTLTGPRGESWRISVSSRLPRRRISSVG